jgi:hypothetical protein
LSKFAPFSKFPNGVGRSGQEKKNKIFPVVPLWSEKRTRFCSLILGPRWVKKWGRRGDLIAVRVGKVAEVGRVAERGKVGWVELG